MRKISSLILIAAVFPLLADSSTSAGARGKRFSITEPGPMASAHIAGSVLANRPSRAFAFWCR